MKKLFSSRITVAISTAITTIPLALAINYFWLAPSNIHSGDFWSIIYICGVVALGLSFLFNYIYLKVTDTRKEIYYLEDFVKTHIVPTIIIVCLGILILATFITGISGWKVFRAKDYSSKIEIVEGDFKEDILDVNSEDLVFVDFQSAKKLGDRTLGSLKNASWYNVDQEYNLVSINGEEYRISSLKYRDVFAQYKSKGIPGYVLVNAKTQEAKLISLKENMKYHPSAYFSYKLERHLHKNYPTYMFGSKSFFETDDEGTPYWITPVQEATIGLRKAKITKNAIITNAITGEMTEYSISDLPEWVDHVDNVQYLMERLEWHYKYQEGYINPSKTNYYYTTYHFAQKASKDENDYTPFDGYNSVITKSGEIMFYTGLTPANKAETNIGFILVSPRTGKATYYAVNGAEEFSAQLAAEGLVQNLNYSASFPIVLNVEGEETYFMTLKDNAGLIQRYSLCQVSQYMNVVEAETIEKAIEKYKEKLGLKAANDSYDNDSNIMIGTDQVEIATHTEKKGIVTRVAESIQIDGNTYYIFELEGVSGILISSIKNNYLQPVKLVSGAKVSIKFAQPVDNSKYSNVNIVEKLEFIED